MVRLVLTLVSIFVGAAIADAKSMYTVPPSTCANNGDGTASTCAASAGATGAFRGLSNVAWGAGANEVSDGDTLYICGFHDGGNTSPADNALAPTSTNITIDGNCAGNAGSILAANKRYTSGWTGPDAFGAYSQATTGVSSMHIVQLVDGVPTRMPYVKTAVPDATWENGSFYHDTTGFVLYVKPIGGVNPATTTIYTTWTTIFTFTNVAVTVQNLTIYGLASGYCFNLSGASRSIIQDNTIKWCATIAVRLTSNANDVTIRRNDFSESGNGVYSVGVTTATNNDRATVSYNTFYDMDQDGYYGASVTDNHAIGVQGGDGWLVHRNDIARISGTCITFFSYAAQVQRWNQITANTCDSVRNDGAGVRVESGIEYSNINASHDPNDTIGNVVAGNVVTNVQSICLFTKSQQPSTGAPWAWVNNTAANCGKGFMFREDPDGNVGFIFANNILLNNTQHIDHFVGSDTFGGVIFTNNRYYPDGATLFEWDGTQSAFASWQTNSSQDDNSSIDNPTISSTDYRLAANSNARRAGISGYLCKDVRGRACYHDSPDIGAYQSTSGDPANTRTARQ